MTITFFQSSFDGDGAAFCGICGRQLTNPTSVAIGIGPVCRGHAGVADDIPNDASDNFVDEFLFELPLTSGLVLQRDEITGVVRTNVPHVAVSHSPCGFEFGYAGSGPADLALNLCEVLLNKWGYDGPTTPVYNGQVFDLAWEIHQTVKFAIISPAPREGTTIPHDEVVAAVVEAITTKTPMPPSIRQHADVVAYLGEMQ